MANYENEISSCDLKSNTATEDTSHTTLDVSILTEEEVINRVEDISTELKMLYQNKYYPADPSSSSSPLDDTPSKSFKDIKKVKQMDNENVVKNIELCKEEIKKHGLKLVDQRPSNTKFVGQSKETSRIALIDGNKRYTPTEAIAKVFLRVLYILETNCKENEYMSLRALYYMDVDLFCNQSRSDRAVDQVACQLGCTRSSLNVFGSDTGRVIGPISFRLEMTPLYVDCSIEVKYSLKYKFGVPIPPFLHVIDELESDANFVLIVEKYSTFIDLAQHNFHKDYNCIIITGGGMSGLATREFVNHVMIKLKIPMFTLTDCDPWGLAISTVYSHGSDKLAYCSKNLASPLIYWLGVWPTDLTSFDIALET